ncbi:septum formation family protein [Marinactinospora rubrisoli]|uniref:Septum formation family protein n=1 Tax=Marinactinospora rubrisoli TaxID=2715399 RepID=A0ABW2KN09_9ACTN
MSQPFGAYLRAFTLGSVALGAAVTLSACGALPGLGAPAQQPADNGASTGTDAGTGADTGSEAPAAGAEDADVFDIAVGDCLNDAAMTGEVQEVPVISCDQPHDSEVYASVMMDDGAFPGDEAVNAEAETECDAEFTNFVGLPYMESVLLYSWYVPTEQSWAGGDREILCLISSPDGQTTGSLQGANR